MIAEKENLSGGKEKLAEVFLQIGGNKIAEVRTSPPSTGGLFTQKKRKKKG